MVVINLQIQARGMSERKLHRDHFAFMRALVQGVSLATSWDQYLAVEGEHTDARIVKRTIRWIRDEFAAAAKRERKPGTARLVLLDAQALSDEAAALPSLTDFAQANGLEEFSEAEQAEAFADAFGAAAGKSSRRARIVARQLEALRWLEQLAAQEPGGCDGVQAWFAPALASRLQGAGLMTLQDLASRINGTGARWWVNVPGVGVGKGGRIVEWLRQHQRSTGLSIGVHVDVKRSELKPADLAQVVPAATAIVPFEKFIMPASLDGSAGAYRAPRTLCLLGVDDDYSAISAWLASKAMEPNWQEAPTLTQRAYRREAERLMLWTVMEARKPLSSLTTQDAQAFISFLRAPPERWCGPRHRQRWSELWRPLEGPLSATSIAHAVTILGTLFGFLMAQGYTVGNPFTGVAVPRGAGRPLGSTRTLTFTQWDAFNAALDLGPSTSASRRRARAMRWLYATGLRRSEMVAARCGHLTRIDYRTSTGEVRAGWLLLVNGKGDRVREVPVPAGLIADLGTELAAAGLNADPASPQNEAVQILAKFAETSDGKAPEGLTASGLHKLIKAAAAALPPDLHDTMRRVSAHWLRHSNISHAVNGRTRESAVPVHVVRENVGHASVGTTSLYLATERDARIEAMTAFWAAPAHGA